MTRPRAMLEALLPWSGIAGSALGGGLAHQLGSDLTMHDCPVSTPLITIFAAVLGLLIVGTGAFGSWKALTTNANDPARKLVAQVALMLSALVSFAILLPVIAALVIPTCFA